MKDLNGLTMILGVIGVSYIVCSWWNGNQLWGVKGLLYIFTAMILDKLNTMEDSK